ncbi:GNAT family N-acetyltransferase [Paraliomyxa miuraensis]|uniref:GNAT family N-acetyltransferase n=1 Tax=Paraliomyxa miuraensis TaxID=376150 RepID=UPI00225C051B|nr:GNAT family N-acetyltransferase [Paraliomyxa miuraensis]MCX4241592.1 GNAT family N-acetyltransferase [Paraliomyxa miuraensis]
MTNELRIERLTPEQATDAFEVVVELRTHLDQGEYARRLALQRAAGYELVGAFEGDRIVGVLGMRRVDTLARGPHLHVDDLVVRSSHRGRGIGKQLLGFAEQDARERGLVALFLDSRQEVIGFYEHLGYGAHAALLMRKPL